MNSSLNDASLGSGVAQGLAVHRQAVTPFGSHAPSVRPFRAALSACVGPANPTECRSADSDYGPGTSRQPCPAPGAARSQGRPTCEWSRSRSMPSSGVTLITDAFREAPLSRREPYMPGASARLRLEVTAAPITVASRERLNRGHGILEDGRDPDPEPSRPAHGEPCGPLQVAAGCAPRAGRSAVNPPL